MALQMSVTSPHGPSNATGYVMILGARIDNLRKRTIYRVAHFWDQTARNDRKRAVDVKTFDKDTIDPPSTNLVAECYADLKTRNVGGHDYTAATDV